MDHQQDHQLGGCEDTVQDCVQIESHSSKTSRCSVHLATLDAKAFKCRFLGYEEGVKGYQVLNVTMGKVQIVRTVKVMETTNVRYLLGDKEEQISTIPVMNGQSSTGSMEIFPADIEAGDVIALQRDVGGNREIVPNESTHPMIPRLLTRHIDEIDDPEEGVGLPKTYTEATSDEDRDEYKKTIVIAHRKQDVEAGTKTESPAPDLVICVEAQRQREVTRYKARLVTKGIDYEEIYSAVGYQNSIRAVLAKCCGEEFEIERCNVDTAFLYGKLDEEIYMELPEGLRELLTLADGEGEVGVVCLLLQICMAASKHLTIDGHLKGMGFKVVDANPGVYTRGGGDDECIVCLYVYEMLIASRDKGVIASVKAVIEKKFWINDLGQACFIMGIKINYDMDTTTLGISNGLTPSQSLRKNEKPSLIPLDPSLHITKDDGPQTEEDKTKMKSRPYRSLIGNLIMRNATKYSVAVSKLSRFLENHGEAHWNTGIKVMRYLLKPKSYADWACNHDDRRSVSGMMLMICGVPVVWRSTFQRTVALNSTEAEYMVLSECIKEVDIGGEQVDSKVIHEDNQSAMAKKVSTGKIELLYEESKNQLAAFLTKGLSSEALRYLMAHSNVGPEIET
ncbi:LOW QUALITY PROTEIN: Integrase, catalytic core protein [Phytophthora megakarya]|uniref:Integrase, catalytic core protein n=1 Tax=Phytophthora megakarya TaxID=4795 RepID=A0A225WS18_9STRA|nr:LOW QUALITY PROTEIN: Integrase, catalytic core protein [Phytophthora megakarya]